MKSRKILYLFLFPIMLGAPNLGMWSHLRTGPIHCIGGPVARREKALPHQRRSSSFRPARFPLTRSVSWLSPPAAWWIREAPPLDLAAGLLITHR